MAVQLLGGAQYERVLVRKAATTPGYKSTDTWIYIQSHLHWHL